MVNPCIRTQGFFKSITIKESSRLAAMLTAKEKSVPITDLPANSLIGSADFGEAYKNSLS